jgi:hypothetical protein
LLTALPSVPATLIPVGGTPQDTPIGAAYGTLLQVQVTDSYGNPIAGQPVVFTAPSSGASAVFQSLPTELSNAQGIATAPAMTANHVRGSFTVTASAGSLSASFQLSNTAVPAAVKATAGTGQKVAVGSLTGYTGLVARVTDSSGKPIPGVSVTFTADPGSTGAGGVFSSSAVVLTNTNGLATAPALLPGRSAGVFHVLASVSGLARPAVFTLTNTAASAKGLAAVAGSTPQSTAANSLFGRALQVVVTDAYGNPLGGVRVTFTVVSNPGSGAGALFGKSVSVTVTSNAQGLATAPRTLLANGHKGSFTVSAAMVGALAPVVFTLNNV